MENIQLWLLLLPLFLLQFALQIFALVHLVRRGAVAGGKLIWGAVVVCFGILGSIAYFMFAKEA